MTRTRSMPSRRTLLVVFVVLGAAVALALTQPWLLFVDEVATESLPVRVADAPPPTPSAAPSAAAAPDDDRLPDPMDGDTMAPDATTSQPTPSPAAPTAGEPEVLATGTFGSRSHETSGTVALVRLGDGDVVLTIEDLATDNGPDLFVYLDDDPADAQRQAFDDGLDLGRLRGNVGDLVYDVPDDAPLEELTTVVIWCDRFSVVFGTADLVPVAADPA